MCSASRCGGSEFYQGRTHEDPRRRRRRQEEEGLVKCDFGGGRSPNLNKYDMSAIENKPLRGLRLNNCRLITMFRC